MDKVKNDFPLEKLIDFGYKYDDVMKEYIRNINNHTTVYIDIEDRVITTVAKVYGNTEIYDGSCFDDDLIKADVIDIDEDDI